MSLLFDSFLLLESLFNVVEYVFVIHSRLLYHKLKVAEATKLGVPVVGLVDTNGDPRTIKYPVPCNDDALKTIELVCDYVRQAIEIGKSKQKEAPEVTETKTAVKVESMHDKAADKVADKPAPKADDKKVEDKKEK